MADNDLISRSALIACIGDVGNDPEDDTTFLTMGQACAIAHKSIVNLVKVAPAVDAVEVVRCKDCKSWLRFSVPMVGNCSKHCETTDGDDYCSYGERRADDGASQA